MQPRYRLEAPAGVDNRTRQLPLRTTSASPEAESRSMERLAAARSSARPVGPRAGPCAWRPRRPREPPHRDRSGRAHHPELCGATSPAVPCRPVGPSGGVRDTTTSSRRRASEHPWSRRSGWCCTTAPHRASTGSTCWQPASRSAGPARAAPRTRSRPSRGDRPAADSGQEPTTGRRRHPLDDGMRLADGSVPV